MKKRPISSTFYLVPATQIDAFRNLLRCMQGAIDEIFEEPHLPAEVYRDEAGYAEREFGNEVGEILLNKGKTSLDIDELF